MLTKESQRLLLSGVAVAATIGTAQAQSTTGTAAGTSISNTATASFTVNGAAQTASSNTATFVVDRKVNLTVAKLQAGNTQVNLSQTGAAAAFSVTNNTNAPQDFLLAAAQALSVGILPASDNYDLTNLHVYVDANGNNTYDPGVDVATFIDELAPDASKTVFIVGDVPSTASANLAYVGLNVTVGAGGTVNSQGAALVATVGADRDNQVDIVFADNDSEGDGDLLGDAARNGQSWAYAGFEVAVRSLNLTVNKTATVVTDGVSTLNPKALPGATVQYCLTVNNATLTTPATNVSLTDVIPANTTYVPGSITVGGIGAGGVCLVGGVPIADDGSTTGLYTGSFNATTKTVTATIPLLIGGGSVAASFRVTLN